MILKPKLDKPGANQYRTIGINGKMRWIIGVTIEARRQGNWEAIKLEGWEAIKLKSWEAGRLKHSILQTSRLASLQAGITLVSFN